MQMDTADRTDRLVAGDRQEVVVKSPATGDVVGTVPLSTNDEVKAVAARLRGVQPAWQKMGVQERARWLAKWRDWMLDHTDELLAVLQLESGKSWGDSGVEMMPIQIINWSRRTDLLARREGLGGDPLAAAELLGLGGPRHGRRRDPPRHQDGRGSRLR